MQDKVNQEVSEKDEVDGTKKGADSTGKVMNIKKSGCWYVIRKIQMVEQGYQQTRSGFYFYTEM